MVTGKSAAQARQDQSRSAVMLVAACYFCHAGARLYLSSSSLISSIFSQGEYTKK